jgi:hypothetical protein
MDAGIISALSALGGATIGGLASFSSSWLTQRNQLKFSHREAIRAKREALYAEFVDEASRCYGEAMGHQKDTFEDLSKLLGLLGRIRLVSPRPVVTSGEQALDMIVEAYLGPNRTLNDIMADARQQGFRFLIDFGEACRQDLDA